MSEIRDMSFDELTKLDPKTHSSVDELGRFIEELVNREHDYNTCVPAMSLAAYAAFNYVAHKLGVTGFQASCADSEFIRRTRNWKHGGRLIDYGNLLYPQYLTEAHFPSLQTLLKEQASMLAKAAKKLLDEQRDGELRSHPDVEAHWRHLVNSATPEEGADV